MNQAQRRLIYTSVDDLRNTLRCSLANGGHAYRLEEVQIARDLAESLEMKSKVKVFEWYLRKFANRGKGDWK